MNVKNWTIIKSLKTYARVESKEVSTRILQELKADVIDKKAKGSNIKMLETVQN